MQDPLASAQPRLPRAVVLLGAFFLLAVTIASMLQGASVLQGLLAQFPRRIGVDGFGVVVAGSAGVAAALWVGLLAGRSRLTDRQILIGGLVAVALVRGAAVVLMESPVPNDGLVYQQLARGILDGACCFADRPTGYPFLLAAAYALLGDGTWVHEWLNVLAAVIGGGLLFGMAREGLGRGAASVAVFLYAALPSQVLLTPVLLTDTVYATLLIGLCWTAMRMARGGLVSALAGGALLAASQYVRPVGPALLLAMALVPLLFVRPMRRALLMLAVLALAFGALMTPAVVHNLSAHGDPSVSTSSYGGWSLLMGTNQERNGRYNAGDAAIVNSLPGDNLWERSDAAGELGLQRITSDPIGFAGLALRKFRIMWATEDFGVVFGFRPGAPPRHALGGLVIVSQLAYLLVVLAALWALIVIVRLRAPPAPLVVAAIALLLAEALVHTFLEVKPRYHAHTEPLLILLASPVIAGFPWGHRLSWLRRALTLDPKPVADRSDRDSHRSAGERTRRTLAALLILLVPLAALEGGVRALVAQGHLPVARAHSRDFEISWMNLERAGNVDVLVLGDSVAQQGIYPPEISERMGTELGRTVTAFNEASAAGTLGVNLAILRQLAEEGRLPKVVLLGIQPGILRDDSTLAIFGRTPMGQLFTDCTLTVDLESQLDCRLGQVSTAWRWRGQLEVVWRAIGRPARRTSSFEGLKLRTDGFREGFGISQDRLEKQLPVHIESRPDAFVMGPTARDRYLELVRFLEAHDTPLVPIAVPEAPEVAAALERRHPGWAAEWHAALADLSVAGGIQIADPMRFGDWYGEGSMRNIKHLSLVGAQDFTGQLLDISAVHDRIVAALNEGASS